MAEDKELAFGKVYNKVGSTSVNLILQTQGDVKIKTPNRYVTIFKNGKLNVDNTSEIFEVSSEDEIKKTGIYLVNKTSDSGDESQLVYLNVDGIKILLASSSEGYISYSAVQELKPENFIQALSNIGLYFESLNTAQNSGIQNGIVFTLDTGILYKVVNGQFSPIAGNTSDENKSENSKESNIPNPLQIGRLLIDGNQMSIEGDSLIFNIGGQNVIAIRGGKIYVNNDVVLSNKQITSTQGAAKGKSGYMLYTEDGETWLEVDNLIVHNQSSTGGYNSQYFPSKIGSPVSNMIVKASWADTPTSGESGEDNDSWVTSNPTRIKLTLKYRNDFTLNDWLLVFISSSNAANINKIETDTGEAIVVEVANNVRKDTTLEVIFTTETPDGNSKNYTQSITIPAGSNYAKGTDFNSTDETFDKIKSVKIISGDEDIYWNYFETSNLALPAGHYATVESIDPFIINVKGQDSTSNSVLTNLQNSIIYRLSVKDANDYVLLYYKNHITLYDALYGEEFIDSRIHLKIGDLSNIYKDYRKDKTSNDKYSGYGLYTDKLIGVFPLFIGGTFTGITGKEYPKYDDTLTIPEEITDDMNKVIPDIEMVKKIASSESDDLLDKFRALQDNVVKLTDRVSLLETKMDKVLDHLNLNKAEID